MDDHVMMYKFWLRVKITNGCWLWQGPKNLGGYGTWSHGQNGKAIRLLAHRVGYQWKNGPIPKGMCVCHHCDVANCVNPDHLFLGTYRDNMQDAVKKGRMATGINSGNYTHPERRPRGKRHGRYTQPHRTARGLRSGRYTHPERNARGERVGTAKMTWEKVGRLRAMVHGGISVSAAANHFGVCYSTARRIVCGDNWDESYSPCLG